MCLYPKLIPNRKYRANKKNGGNIPPIKDMRTLKVPIGCQQCIECRKQIARAWQVRLLEDIKTNRNGKFITLTFSNKAIKELREAAYEINEARIRQHYNNDGKKGRKNTRPQSLEGYRLDNEIATIAVRRFVERWRKKYKKSIRHWLVTELGHKGTENIHLHGIIWTDKSLDEVEKIWQYGWIWKGYKRHGRRINYVNGQTANYITKYVHKTDRKHKTFKGRVLTSPGIGSNYTKTFNSTKNKYNDTKTDETYRTNSGYKIALPIYWRNKIFTDKERESLWLHRLDKLERWVCGQRVSIKNGYEKYDKLVKEQRRRNIELGYGNGEIDWNRVKYENERRKILHETRIKAAA